MSLNSYLAVAFFIIFGSISFAGDLKFRPIEKNPEVKFNAYLTSQDTDFSQVVSTTRSSGANVFKKAFPSVVKVLAGKGFGTAVAISEQDNGIFITNNHVIAGHSNVALVFPTDEVGGKRSFARVVKVDEISDLALLSLNERRSDIIPITFADQEIEIGDDVHAIGHPLGQDWTYTRGYVSQIRSSYAWATGITEHHVANIIQTQTPINPGNSGGPLLNDNAELVGLNTFINVEAQGLNYSLDLSTIRSFLSSSGDIHRVSFDENSSVYGKLINSLDENKNGNPDFYSYDKSANMVPDRFIIDSDEDLWADIILIDENENGIIELKISFTVYEGDDITLYEFDENEDDVPDLLGVDIDQDGNIDHIEPIS